MASSRAQHEQTFPRKHTFTLILYIRYKLLIYNIKNGTSGHRTRDLSIYFHSNFISQFLQMPPRVPPQGVGCHRTSLDIMYAPAIPLSQATYRAVVEGLPYMADDLISIHPQVRRAAPPVGGEPSHSW
jgi:hypothetical protein